jgi:acyl-CoA dehydrogenase
MAQRFSTDDLQENVAHYLLKFGSESQKMRWLPGIVSGEISAAIAMTEAGTGSDLKGVRTRADWRGDSYVINGAKTIISTDRPCDAVLVVAKTDPASGSEGLSLFIVDTRIKGCKRGQVLDASGMEGQEMSEILFAGCAVPPDCLLGGVEGQGFYQLFDKLGKQT